MASYICPFNVWAKLVPNPARQMNNVRIYSFFIVSVIYVFFWWKVSFVFVCQVESQVQLGDDRPVIIQWTYIGIVQHRTEVRNTFHRWLKIGDEGYERAQCFPVQIDMRMSVLLFYLQYLIRQLPFSSNSSISYSSGPSSQKAPIVVYCPSFFVENILLIPVNFMWAPFSSRSGNCNKTAIFVHGNISRSLFIALNYAHLEGSRICSS